MKTTLQETNHVMGQSPASHKNHEFSTLDSTGRGPHVSIRLHTLFGLGSDKWALLFILSFAGGRQCP